MIIPIDLGISSSILAAAGKWCEVLILCSSWKSWNSFASTLSASILVAILLELMLEVHQVTSSLILFMLNGLWEVREAKIILEIIISQILENKIQGLRIVTVLLLLFAVVPVLVNVQRVCVKVKVRCVTEPPVSDLKAVKSECCKFAYFVF